jgi:DNA-binding CsgD family transcriptional regulator
MPTGPDRLKSASWSYMPALHLPVETPVRLQSIPVAELKIVHDRSWTRGVSKLLNDIHDVEDAIVVIDHLGFVLSANPSASHLFGDSVYVSNRRLKITDRQSRNSLEALIQTLIYMPTTDVLPSAQPIVIQRAGKRPIIAKALSVPAATRNLLWGARVILRFVPIEPKPRPNASLLSKIFGLTFAEAKLAAALADGTSLDTAAEELDISRQTARSQLKIVFAKTDTHRQGQLIALLSRL